MEFAFPMSNGYTRIGPYPVLLGSSLTGNLFDNPSFPIPLGRGKTNTYFFLGDPVVRMWYRQDPNSSFTDFDYRQYQARIQQISAMYDSSAPAMDAFRANGGKLIIVQGTNDMLVPERATTAYYESVQRRYGVETPTFVRYYVQPGFEHGAGDFAMSWNALAALDTWVESGQAPANPVSMDTNAATRGRTRPLCEYPLFPKYNGSGDLNQAASYTCSAS